MSKRNGNSNGNGYKGKHSEYVPVRNCPRCRGALYYSYELMKKKPVIKCFQCGAYYKMTHYHKKSPEEVMSVKMVSPIQDKNLKIKSGKRLDFDEKLKPSPHDLIFNN